MPLLWIGLWINTAVAAQISPTCVKKTSKTAYQEPADLKALLGCQKRKLTRCAAGYEARHGDLPSDETLEIWRELQRRELRDFIRRHPTRSVIEGPSPSGAQAKPAQAGAEKSQAQDIDALRQDLLEKSDQGRKGVTPEMAAEIVATLMKEQGSVSGDMADLLSAVQKDGSNLSGDTFRRLQDAARKADAAGLDLGVSPDIKDFLLRGDSTKDQPAAAPAAPGVD
jgi:hypothetical protein